MGKNKLIMRWKSFTFKSFRIDQMNDLSDSIAYTQRAYAAQFFGQFLRKTNNIILDFSFFNIYF